MSSEDALDLKIVEVGDDPSLDPGVARVKEFHEAFQVRVFDSPFLPILSPAESQHLACVGQELQAMARLLKLQAAEARELHREALAYLLIRIQLITEECGELAEAVAAGDLVGTLDGLTDLSYVVDGTYLTVGMHALKAAAYDEVHRSNMSKLGSDGRPILHASGRVEKGPNYSPPNLARVLAKGAGGE